MQKTLLISFISAVVVFVITYALNYHRLLSLQPPQDPNGILPENVTSFPPSAAWLSALPLAVVVFVIAFIIISIFSYFIKSK